MTSVVFWVGVLTLVGFYGILAMILNMEGGWGGMWDLGTAGLLAVASYFFVIVTLDDAMLGTRFAPGWPLWLAWPASAVFTGIVAFLVSLPALRLRREYFLITTFAFAEIIRQLIVVQDDLTRGVIGFSGLDRPFDDVVTGRDYNYVLLGLVAIGVVVVFLITRVVARSSFGLLLRAARDNEALALSLGRKVNRMRRETFVLAGVLIGAVAPLYLWYIRAVTPQLFAPAVTFTAWSALVLGGLGSIAGPILGAFLLIVFTEAVGLVDWSPDQANLATALEPFLVGMLLIVVLRVRPQGLLGERGAFRRATRRDRSDDATEPPANDALPAPAMSTPRSG